MTMNKCKIILSAIRVVILALCLSSVTYAWFSNNKEVRSTNTGMTIQSVSDVTILSAYALRYDGTIGAVCYKIGDGEGEVTDVEMTEYDRIFQDRSVNTPLIYVVELGNVSDTAGYYIYVKIPCNERFLRVNNSYTTNEYIDDKTENFVIQRFISNIVSVKVACGGPLPSGGLEATTTNRIENNVSVFQNQKVVLSLIESGDAVGQFASAIYDDTTEETTYNKTTSVQVRISQADYHSSIYTGLNENNEEENRLMLYIQFDYDKPLMNAFIEHMMDDSEGDISFADDLGVIQILVKAGGS